MRHPATYSASVRALSFEQRASMTKALQNAALVLWDGVGVIDLDRKTYGICAALLFCGWSSYVMADWIDSQLRGHGYLGLWQRRNGLEFTEQSLQADRHEWLQAMIKELNYDAAS